MADKWKDEYYVEAYCMAREGLSDAQINTRIGVTPLLFRKWLQTKPALIAALRKGRESLDETLRDHVYDHLDDASKKVWDELMLCWEGRTSTDRVRAIFERQPKQVRQSLLLYAVVYFDFNSSTACSKLRVSEATLRLWLQGDREFSKLWDDIQRHKGNFFEGELVKAVKKGDTSAILFANKTYNRARGYGDAVTHTHHHEAVFTLTMPQLMALPVTVREMLRGIMAGGQEDDTAPSIGDRDGEVYLVPTKSELRGGITFSGQNREILSGPVVEEAWVSDSVPSEECGTGVGED
jgi:hypothetical protein